MKNLYLLFFLSLIALPIDAQISLNSVDFPTAGWVNALHKDTAVGTVNFGAKGANQTYDFSMFTPDKNDTVFYKAMTGTQQTNIPNGNLAATSNNIDFIFFNRNSSNYTIEGIEGDLLGLHSFIAFSPPSIQAVFTTQYGKQFNSSTGFTKTELGANFTPALPVYKIRATNFTVYKDTIDGWGKVKTPIGTYACLREKRTEISNTQIDVQLSQIIPTWTAYQTIKDTTVRYYYLTRESKGNIITFTYDSLDNPLTASWSTVLPIAPVAVFNDTFTGNNSFSFTDASLNYPDSFAWNFGDGSVSTLQNPVHTYANSGSYVVCLTVTNAGGSNTVCDTIVVLNHAPIAQNDTATTNNGGSVTTNVGMNDSDIDGNNFCVTALIGSSNFQIAPTGNCTSIFYTADSNFAGKDTCYYVICDNGSPTLCDTGMYVVNVRCVEVFEPYTVISSDTIFFDNTHVIYQGSFSVDFYANNQKADSVVWIFTSQDIVNPLTINKKNIVVSINSSNYVVDSIVYIRPFIVAKFCANAYFPCGVITVCDSVIFTPEGISEIGLSAINIYPNPTSKDLTIDLSNLAANDRKEIAYFSLYDMMGREVKRIALDNELQKKCAVDNLSKGIYQLMVTSKDNTKKAVNKICIE